MNNKYAFRRYWIIIWLGMFALIFAAKGVLPPSEYLRMQKEAPEVLEIEVMSVKTEPGTELAEERVLVTAVAVKIERTESGIKPGDILQIFYTVRTKSDGLVGRDEVPLLEERKKTVAFLRSQKGKPFYLPAAGAMSFSRF